MNSNFRYNFAYLFKLRVFIRLAALILNGKLPENFVRHFPNTKWSGFPNCFGEGNTIVTAFKRRTCGETSVEESVDFWQRLTARIASRQCELFLHAPKRIS